MGAERVINKHEKRKIVKKIVVNVFVLKCVNTQAICK